MRAEDDTPSDSGCALLEPRAQELVAIALTLMTRHALEHDEAERGESAGIVADALHELAGRDELVPELRRLCVRLERLWSDAAA